MKRNVPAKNQNTLPWYRCPTRGCYFKTIKCNAVENVVLEAMRGWLSEYTVKVNTDSIPESNNIETSLLIIQNQLTELHLQQNKICELLEKGVYTVDMFTKRNNVLNKEIQKLQSLENDLLKRRAANEQSEKNIAEIIPTTQHILENYEHLSISEKNSLWKIVLEKITVYRPQNGEFDIHIYPKLPM